MTPQPIAADERHELGSLAAVYNGAIEQMERAFAARDRANTSMRQFIADAGHQLRTPLTVVQGFIAILRRGGIESAPDRDRILDTMTDQSRIMGALIDKLILLERWESVQTPQAAAPIDVGTLVADLISPIADAHPDRHFEVSTQSGVLAAIDPTELGYVVTNLADNAVKYGEGAIAVAVSARDGTAIIEVADRGPGIPSTDATRVFDRFYRGTQRDVAGSGLGLAIVKRAVERAGGTISLDTSPNGSRFTVQLPRICHPKASSVALSPSSVTLSLSKGDWESLLCHPEPFDYAQDRLCRRVTWGSLVTGGGEGEIRTHGTLLTFARFRGGCLQPLDHLSKAEGWDGGGTNPSSHRRACRERTLAVARRLRLPALLRSPPADDS